MRVIKKPNRFWLSSGFAAVLAAARQPSTGCAEARLSRLSPLPLADTVDRLEHEARAHGLPVFARVGPAQPSGAQCGAELDALLLVLCTSAAQTPVLQTSDGGLELPLALHLARRADGATEVQFSDGQWLAAQIELPGICCDRLPGCRI